MKIVKCPICNHTLENVTLANGFDVEFNKPLKFLPYITWCDNCKRKIKYDVIKSDKEAEING